MADSKISEFAAVTSLLAADEFVLARSGATKKITAANLMLFDAYAYIRDEKAAGTNGGGSTSGSFQTRDLNTEASDPSGIVSISSNQFTLAAGLYWIVARSPFRQVGPTKMKLRDITNGADLIIGSTAFTDTQANNDQTDGWVRGRITLAGSTAIAVQYRCGTSTATNGLGVASNYGVVEVYTEVEIWREVA